MRYDDRLRTVLAQPAAHPHDRAIRWRQLVELLARGRDAADPDLVEQAVAAVSSDSALVPESVRMAAARAIAPFPAPLPLICAFAADRLNVAAPVLAAARLTASEWAEVSRSAAPECRRFIASLETNGACGRSSTRSPGRFTGRPTPTSRSRRSPKCWRVSNGCANRASSLSSRRSSRPATAASGGARRTAPVPLGMRRDRADRLGRGRAARPADRPLARRMPMPAGRPARARLFASAAVPRSRSGAGRRDAGRGRVEDQRRSGVRTVERPLRRLSRHCRARMRCRRPRPDRRPARSGFAARPRA